MHQSPRRILASPIHRRSFPAIQSDGGLAAALSQVAELGKLQQIFDMLPVFAAATTPINTVFGDLYR